MINSILFLIVSSICFSILSKLSHFIIFSKFSIIKNIKEELEGYIFVICFLPNQFVQFQELSEVI